MTEISFHTLTHIDFCSFSSARMCLYSLKTNTQYTYIDLYFCLYIILHQFVEIVFTYFTVLFKLITFKRMSFQLCVVRSIHILSTSIHSSCEQYNCTHLFTHSWMQASPARRTPVHKSWRWSTTQTFHSPQTTNPTSYSDVFQRKKEKEKRELSQWECHLTLLCFRISYLPLGRHVWNLWIRIFNDTQ